MPNTPRNDKQDVTHAIETSASNVAQSSDSMAQGALSRMGEIIYKELPALYSTIQTEIASAWYGQGTKSHAQKVKEQEAKVKSEGASKQ